MVLPDSDGDGVSDRTDNCRLWPNPDQVVPPTPVVTSPPDLTIASCADHQIGIATATDLCDATAVSVSNDAPTTFLLGTNVVTWTGQDAKQRVGGSTQLVTVVDTTPPIFTSVPPDIALNDCKAAPLGLPTAVDDCAGMPTFTNNAPAIFPVGATVVTWTASDVSHNHTTVTQTVTVTDTVPPTIACVPAGPPGGTFKVSASDACGAPTIRLGSYVLANGERIKINEVGQSGVTLINVVGPDSDQAFPRRDGRSRHHGDRRLRQRRQRRLSMTEGGDQCRVNKARARVCVSAGRLSTAANLQAEQAVWL